jgi:hypothetical protein
MGTGFVTSMGAQIGQSTPSTQYLYGGMGGGRRMASRRKRVKTSKRAKMPRRKRASAKRGRPARLVKGSRAAKAYMAKIRRKRRK